MGYKATTFTVIEELPYVPVIDVLESKILVIDRNGIGVRLALNFANVPVLVDVLTYEWFGIKLGSLSSGNRLIVLYNNTSGGNREILYEFGPSPTPGSTYSVFSGSLYAKYKVQTGDTTTNVRNGLKASIDAVSWGVPVVTTSVSTNQLKVNITGVSVNFTTQLGTEKYKKGRFCNISGTNYIIDQYESNTAYPILPALAANYNFTLLTAIIGSVQTYLQEPLTTIVYSQSITGSTNILGVSSSTNVPSNTCVLDEANQRIYFDGNLGLGEKIKVFQK